MRVVAAIDGTSVTPQVLRLARAAAAALGVPLEAVHGGDAPAAIAAAGIAGVPLHRLDGDVATALRATAAAPDTLLLVVGARATPDAPRAAGHVTEDLMTSLSKALLVVPPDHGGERALHRMVVALDGTARTASALEPVVLGALERGLEVVAVHVLDPEGAPPFADQPHHWAEAYGRELRARHAPAVAAPVHLRAGDPPSRLLDAARELDADILALAWSQVLAPGRAAVVRRAIAAGDLPVLLVPLGP